MTWAERWATAELRELEARDLRRSVESVDWASSTLGWVDGQRMRLFSTNDYLGLAFHRDVRGRMAAAAHAWGMGARSSPLIAGRGTSIVSLEAELARRCRKSSSLVVSSGFSANLGVISALGRSGVEIFSDELNHASIIDGCRLARTRGASVRVYRHGDVEHLEALLRASSGAKVIISESLFSMDGDFAPLSELVLLRSRYDAPIVLDESHAFLVCGPDGGGLATELGLSEQVDWIVGTLSKACGVVGGFIACSEALREYLVHRARSYVYSTALPVPVIEAALAGLAISRRPELRQRLSARVEQFARGVGRPARGPIFPWVVGDSRRALELSNALRERGFLVPAVRPPTVAAGSARLRVSLSAAHRPDDVDEFVHALRELTWRHASPAHARS